MKTLSSLIIFLMLSTSAFAQEGSSELTKNALSNAEITKDGPEGLPAEAQAMLTGGYGGPTAPPQGKIATDISLSGRFAGGILFEEIESDYFMTLDIYNTLRIGPVSFGIWVPLRLRVYDQDPQNDGYFRKEDWDEFTDWMRLFRFVELNLGGEHWRFRGRFGQLDGENLGHGTVLGGYYNVLDRAHYQAGIVLDTAIKYGGVKLMIDNLVDPEIFATRIHIRPASFFTENKWANKAILGFSIVGDGAAPTRLVDADNDGVVDTDDDGVIAVENTFLTIIGFDLEYELIRNSLIDLVPYADLNIIADEKSGVGFHIGTFFNLRIPLPILKPTLMTRLEFRAIGQGYAPTYIDSTYEAQRISYNASADLVDPTTNLALTKLAWLRTADSGTAGILGELYFDFLSGWFRVGGSYEDYSGDNNSAITLALLVPKFRLVQAGAYYSNRGFDSMSDAFELENALLRAFINFNIFGPVYFSANYTRTWDLDQDSGDYIAQSNWSVGLGVQFSY